MTEDNNNVQAALKAGQQMSKLEVVEIKDIPHVLHHQDMKLIDLNKLLDKPTRIKANVTVEKAESFIEYFDHFADDHSVIFCDIDSARFKGVIDYHDVKSPSWAEHIVSYQCIKTDEWKQWLDNNGQKFEQTAFAFFIEQAIEDIRSPAGAEMLEVVTSLKSHTNVKFKSSKRLSDGQTQLEYFEETQGSAGEKGQLKIPEEFELGIHIFKGGEAYSVKAKFRFRIVQGQLSMWYDLIRPDKVHDAAVQDEFEKVAKSKCQMIIHGKY